MTAKKLLYFILTIFLLVYSSAFAHEKKWPERRLRQAWPEAQSFTSKQISLTSGQISELKAEGIQTDSKEKSPIFYIAQLKDPTTQKLTNLGAILFIDETGDNGLMEISGAMGTDAQLKKINIWESSENSLVSKDEFLKQFVGRSAKDTFVVEKDYKPIAGAPKASEAVAKAAQKALKISNKLFEKK